MKKMLVLLAILLACCAACAESARDYAAYLEEILPGAAFQDGEVPEYVNRYLGKDYEFIARSDENYGRYVAGVRRDDAPEIPSTAWVDSSGGWSEAGFTNLWALKNGDETIYQFVLGEGVSLQSYDNHRHLVIGITGGQGYPEEIFRSASEHGRTQILYANDHGFTHQKPDRSQLMLHVHNMESWRAGATDQPTFFYLDMTPPDDLLGDYYLDEEEFTSFTRIPIGVYLQDGETKCDLVFSENGTKAVECTDAAGERLLYEAGPGYDALLDLCERLLGYRPGTVDFAGKTAVRAVFEWQDRIMSYTDEAGNLQERSCRAGSVVIEDTERLHRLDMLLAGADFTVGSVNCPSDCFMIVEYSDGSRADFAVALNSFDLFFHQGMYFTTEEDIIDLFQLEETEFYKHLMGG